MKIAELRYQIVAAGDTVEDNELVQISLIGFSSPWHDFVQFICGWENLLDFEQLWGAFIGEEMRLQQVSTSYENVVDLALIKKVRKGRKK
jgi:hypothetical protein